jgi:hypothetical protein
LTSEEFDELVIEAKEYYYKNILENTPIGIEGEA